MKEKYFTFMQWSRIQAVCRNDVGKLKVEDANLLPHEIKDKLKDIYLHFKPKESSANESKTN